MQNSDIFQQYSKFAPYYQEVGQKRGLFEIQARFLHRIFSANANKNCTILDSCCATADVLLNLSNHFPSYALYGSDGCLDFILRARENAKEKNIDLRHCEWLNLGNVFEAGKFDYICSLGNSIGHATSEYEFSEILKTVKRLLKEDGSFIFDLRTWHSYPSNHSFNEPYVNDKHICLSNGAEYSTEYHYDDQKHYLTHTIFKNGNFPDVIKIQLYYFDYSMQKIESMVQENGLCIKKKFDNYDEYPFLSYQVVRCK